MLTPETEKLGPFLVNRFGDRYLYEVNRNTFNQAGSGVFYTKHFGNSLRPNDRLHIFVGTDAGLLVRFIRSQDRPAGSRFLFVELPQVYTRLQEEELLDGLPDWMAVITPEVLQETAQRFQMDTYIYLESALLRESLAVRDNVLTAYGKLYTMMRSWFRREVFRVKNMLGTSSFIVRQLENLAENRHPAAHCCHLFSGKTAVILAGGPSLDQILPWVRDNADNLVIISVSRISRQLLKHGLTPHFIVSIDPQPISFDVSYEMLQMHESSILVHAYHATPLLVAQWAGRSLYLGDLFPWKTALNPDNLPATGPTVTNAALTLATALGCAQVILGGVDLCFSRSGMTHASDSNESQLGPTLTQAEHQVETNGGWLAETNSGFRSAQDILARQAEEAQRQGCRVINPAAGAARLPQVAYLPLDALTLSPLGREALQEALASLPEFNEDACRRHAQDTLAELRRAQGALADMVLLAEQALRANARLFGRGGQRSDFRFKGEMDRIEARLNTEFADFVPLVKQHGLRDFVKTTRVDRHKEWSDADIEAAANRYYQAYRSSAADLHRLVTAALNRVESRLEEISPAPDCSRLFAQWRLDGQPGRAKVWQRHRKDFAACLLPEAAGQLAVFADAFDQLVKDRQAAQAKKARYGRSLSGVRSKAQSLFREKDSAALRQLAHSLKNHPNRNEAQKLGFLLEGYLCELANEVETAMAHYEQLIGEAFTPLAEEALKRVAQLSLTSGQNELACMALDCLANGAVSYKPRYAAVLASLGRYRDAAEVYAAYLEAVPSDLGTLVELGQLYQTAGATDAARQIFQMVRARDPRNAAALTFLGDMVHDQ